MEVTKVYWIPARGAGMTKIGAGMTKIEAGMTKIGAGMTKIGAGMTMGMGFKSLPFSPVAAGIIVGYFFVRIDIL